MVNETNKYRLYALLSPVAVAFETVNLSLTFWRMKQST